jgi:hypothetical protein
MKNVSTIEWRMASGRHEDMFNKSTGRSYHVTLETIRTTVDEQGKIPVTGDQIRYQLKHHVPGDERWAKG